MFNYSFQKIDLPPTPTEAFISLKCWMRNPGPQAGDSYASIILEDQIWIYQEPPFLHKCTPYPKCYVLLIILPGPWSSYIVECRKSRVLGKWTWTLFACYFLFLRLASSVSISYLSLLEAFELIMSCIDRYFWTQHKDVSHHGRILSWLGEISGSKCHWETAT